MDLIDQDKPDYWDKHYTGQPYQDRVRSDHKFWYKFLDQSLGMFELENMKILEIGCGIGQYSRYLHYRSSFWDVLGTDYSSKSIELCRKRHPKVAFEILDVRKLTEKNAFDAIIAFEVIEHFPDPLQVLYNIRRALTPEGKFIFSLPHQDGRFGKYPEHPTLWDNNRITDYFFRFWDQVCFHKINTMCTGTNIFGTAKRIGGD